MNIGSVEQAVQKEMNRRRRHGGAENVPAFLWENGAVAVTVRQAAECAEQEGFNGDWDYASLELEAKLSRLASILLTVTKQSYSGYPAGLTHSVPEPRKMEPHNTKIIRQDVGSRALSEYLSWHLQKDFIMEWCHSEVCGGDYLTREEAWEFLTSPLPKVLSFREYQQLGVCPVKATGRILSKFWTFSDKAAAPDHSAVFLRPANLRFTAEYGLHYTNYGPKRECHYGIEIKSPEWNGRGPFHRRLVIPQNQDEHICVADDKVFGPQQITCYSDPPIRVWAKPVPYFQGEKRYVEGYEDSLMGILLVWADLLSESFSVPIWDMLEAFLTGRLLAPSAVEVVSKPLEVTRTEYEGQGARKTASLKRVPCVSGQAPVTLTVQPWVTPEVLADAWREYRKTNPSYSPTEKQADTLRFVLSHTAPGEEFAWERLAQHWQEERGELITRGQLYKQFQRARAALLPGYRESEAGSEG